ncbi:hypothetical protein EJ110_NYTH11449 [Nymphaea thermarum]|nr:hypothetical protein EJ110_NYTH11449 [Nymphaea thermarum]
MERVREREHEFYHSLRLIHEQILMAHQLVDSLNHHNGASFLKQDLSKTYDGVNFHFLNRGMECLCFPDLWRIRVMTCVTNAAYVVVLNNREGRFFDGGRGLRQGGTLSPYLFLLDMEITQWKRQEKTAPSGTRTVIGLIRCQT